MRDIHSAYYDMTKEIKGGLLYAINWNCVFGNRSFYCRKMFKVMGSSDPLTFSKGSPRMRYHYEKPERYSTIFGEDYACDHPVYNKCTLFKIDNRGLAVIQQRYDSERKTTYWTELDPWLVDELYLHPNFEEFFDERSNICVNGIYPTVTIRQIMWGLKMKPLRRERWETCFDRRIV